MRQREMWGLNEEGLLIFRTRRTHGYDPDEFSYDDKIREKYLSDKRKGRRIKHQYLQPVDWRHSVETSKFLGYPELPKALPFVRFHSNDVMSKHSFEEKFGGDFLPTISKRVCFSNAFDSVVSLTSFVPSDRREDERRLFTCSGIVIDSNKDSTTIVTSAYLVCHVDDDGKLKSARNLEIKVRFGHDEPCYGSLLSCCVNYNLAFIKVKERCHNRPMPMGGRSCLYDDLQVFAIGMHYLSGDTMVTSGRTTSDINPFDCKELMFSTCKITKCGIGGPLVDSTGDLIGINFYDKNDIPYLPTCLILKCWNHVRSKRKVLQPYVGWKLRVIDFQHLSKIYGKHELTGAIVVDKVKNDSPAKFHGICDGDIIVKFCGQPAIFLAECAAVLLDKTFHSWPEPGLEFEVTIVRGDVLKPVSISTHTTVCKSCHDVNRWPLPKLEWKVIPPLGISYRSGHFDDEFHGGVRVDFD